MSEQPYPSGRVRSSQRYTSTNPCPVCGGGADDPEGQGVRCYGFQDATGRYARCTREDFAGDLGQNGDDTFSHQLDVPCRCGEDHRVPHPRPEGLSPADAATGLTVAELADAKGFDVDYLHELRVRDGAWPPSTGQVPAVLIPHWNERGELVSHHVRLALQGSGRFRWQGPMIPYGLWELGRYREGWCLLVFGDSDAWAAWLYDLPAISIPGTSAWRPEWSKHFEGIETVYAWQEPGEEEAIRRVAADLPDLKVIRGGKELKDLCALHQMTGGELPHILQGMLRHAQPAIVGDTTAPPPPAPAPIFTSGFSSARLAQTLRAERPIQLGHDRRLWGYRGGVWRPDAEDWARARTEALLGDGAKNAHWAEVRGRLLGVVPTIAVEQPDPEWLNLANCRLNWRTGEKTEHSPDRLDVTQIPVSWRPEARCPRFDDFLSDVLPADAIEFVWEIIGYLLAPDNRFQKAVMLRGPGGTGKGTLLHVITHVLGKENISAVSLHDLAENRFMAAELLGKLANVLGDLDARAVERSDLFKMITGGDIVKGERKGGSPFFFTPYARLVFSANEPPPTADQTGAYFARWLVVPMTTVFRDTERDDTQLRRRLVERGELEGVLAGAVGALQRLMKRGHFQVPQSVREAGEDFRDRLDVVKGYLDDWISEEAAGTGSGSWWRTPPRKAMYEGFARWCAENGRKPLNSSSFYSRVSEDGRLVPVTVRGVRGFKLLKP